MKKYFTLIACFTLFCAGLSAQLPDISLTTFSSGFNSPVDIACAGDDRLFVVEQPGYIYILDSNGTRRPFPFMDISQRVNDSGSERGLLGMAFDPHFELNGYFYVNYTGSGGASYISRFSVNPTNPDAGDPNSEKILMTVSQPYSNHNAGDLAFGPDGYLYVGFGDGGSAGDPGNRSQNPLEKLGKMLRIDVNAWDAPYNIPMDNPYYGQSDTLPEIWALGLRNPWRYDFDASTGDLWIADVGQNAWEEIDFQGSWSTGGENYGWRCYEGNANYNTSGCAGASAYDYPIFVFNHSTDCSVTGGYRYRGGSFANLWGHYILTDYCSGRFRTVYGDTSAWMNTDQGIFTSYEYSSFGEDMYRELYVTGLGTGNIYKIMDTSCTPAAAILGGKDTVTLCSNVMLEAASGPNLTYQWNLGLATIPGATASTYQPVTSGFYSVTVMHGNCSATSDPVLVTLLPAPTAGIDTLANQPCAGSEEVFGLTGSPAGGVFYGVGVIGDSLYSDLVNQNAVMGGTYGITYTVTDINGCTASDTAWYTYDLCVGVDDALNLDLSVYPSPNEGRFAVELAHTGGGTAELRILDLSGKVILEREAEISDSHRWEIDLSGQAAGMYLVEVRTATGTGHARVFVK